MVTQQKPAALPKDATNLLELIPQPRVEWLQEQDQRIVLLIPRFGSGRLGQWLKAQLKARPVRIRLDEIGSATWQLIDGRRTVGEIGRALQKQFGAKVEPIYERLAVFFKRLEREKFISMILH